MAMPPIEYRCDAVRYALRSADGSRWSLTTVLLSGAIPNY
jgi:hypothetical protein